MGQARPSMQELIQRRRRARFVGRRGELDLFRRNFTFPPEDERHRFVFHIHGNAGVGKTWLVRQLEQAARQEHAALTACVDETADSVPEAMAAISAQFAQQGREFTSLDRMLMTYRQRLHEAESIRVEGDPQTPSAGGLAAARAGLAGIGLIPGIGALTGAVDPAQLAQGADRLRAALSARFRNQQDVQLLLDPLQALTPLLVAEMSKVAAAAPWTVLFFDTYERTGPLLDPWLHTLLTSERYGKLPENAVVVLSGQGPLDPSRWADLSDVVEDLPLEPFTELEARQLLAARGVTDEQVVRDVLRLSGRLPVLVSTLAENAEHPGGVGDPSATAVERFLKWERDPARRSAALAGALPRLLNEDVFQAVVADGAAELFAWVRSLPFVSRRAGRAQYHDVVRAQMIRLQRSGSPQRWSAGHARLAGAFAQWREAAAAGLEPAGLWKHEPWRAPRLEESYHLLCARPSVALPDVLRDGIDACDAGPAVARRWARTLAEAGEDTDSDLLREWGRDTLAALADDRRLGIEVLGLLLARAELDEAGRVAALVVRGWHRRSVEEHEAGLADFRQALALDPGHVRAHFGSVVMYRAMGHIEQALEALDRADRLDPNPTWIPRERAETYRQAGRREEALAEFDRVVEASPADSFALAGRGQIRAELGMERAALDDLDRAIGLYPEYVWALLRRARLRSRLGDVAGALDDLDRAEAVAPDARSVVGERGRVYHFAGRYEEAIEQYDRALVLDPGYAWALGSRAMTHEALGRRTEALADLERAVARDPGYAWALAQRERLLSG
ncbi:tetratricopeptide repeat protein [Streptomyces sp. ME19-01-6]|uniref:tetratricopeptide repeat protein n=1 Tax=Streptomyces sp. ME19-01-6 TaxID=3028686 RepID=UPI0029B11E2D|nr:tetratricopeptide repeat protein [Streptomyces sp. ME19-01-6]MDX3228032.1 tetratricopeptide repeat protein [Streptomyces sp. ME19-01-6]